MGSALGLAVTPLIANLVVWPVGFAVLGGLSTFMTASALLILQKKMQSSSVKVDEVARSIPGGSEIDRTSETLSHARVYRLPQEDSKLSSVKTRSPMPSLSQNSAMTQEPEKAQERVNRIAWHEVKEYAALIYHHSAIGFGFFLFQNWIPTYLQSLNVTDAVLRGWLSALPWAACFVFALAFGRLFDVLRTRGMGHFGTQTLAHSIASVGAAAALVPIALCDNVSPVFGLLCIGGALSLQTCNYSGFHAYIQTTYPKRAGRLLAVTNTCGIGAGIVANLAMGWLVQVTGSYKAMFAITSLVYFISFLSWILCLADKTEKLEVSTI